VLKAAAATKAAQTFTNLFIVLSPVQ